MKRLFLTLLLIFLNAPAAAVGLGIHVVDAGGKPVRDAVVTLRPAGKAGPVPFPARGLAVEQRNLTFHPFVTIVPVGSSVAFPNFDATRHHVYSFSAAKRFEFKLFARDQSRSVTLDRPGTVAVGCNIHDKMSAFLFVTDTSWTAKTDGAGNAFFRDAPVGAVTIKVWHPYLRSPDGSVARQVALGSAPRVEGFAVRLRSPPMHEMTGY